MEKGSLGKVINDFLSTNEGEICLSKNDIVLVIKRIDRYWCYGCSNNKYGNFPTSCVIELEIPQINSNEKLFASLASFPGQQTGDLIFDKGELIVGTNQVDSNWWHGKISERIGVFPITHTWEINIEQIKVSKKCQIINKKAEVLMDMRAQLDEEIDLYKGEIVTLTDIIDDNWFRGSVSGRSGIFPSSFVKVIEDDQLDNNSSWAHDLISQESDNEKLNNYKYGNQSKSENKNLFEDDYFQLNLPSKIIKSPDIFDDEYFQVNMPPKTNEDTNQINNFPNLHEDNYFNITSRSNNDRTSILNSLDISEDDDYFKLNMPSNSNQLQHNIHKSPLEVDIVPYGFTLYPFYAQFENELSFYEGEIVQLIRHIDSDWIEGSIDGRKGIFPAHYVNIVIDCDNGPTFQKNIKNKCENTKNELVENSSAIVLYNFDAQMEGDLSINEGQLVLIMENISEEWCKVIDQQGKSGLCPKNYLGTSEQSFPNFIQIPSLETNKEHSYDNLIINNLEKISSPEPSITQRTSINEKPKINYLKELEENLSKTTNKSENYSSSANENLSSTEKENIPFQRQDTIQRRTPHRPVPPVPVLGKSPLRRTLKRVNNMPPEIKDKNVQKLNNPENNMTQNILLKQTSLEEIKKKNEELRQNLITELVFTEKEYLRDLKITYETFNLHNPRILEARGIDVKGLFGNILEVMHVSETFLDSLQLAMKGKEEQDQLIGPCFIEIADQMKNIYGIYCMNHDNALLLLEKYESIEEIKIYFEKGLETLRYQIACFNMGSILIKPVQRILKYPLILNELIKATETEHKDKKYLNEAAKIIIDVASYINEYKRRKDIVSKYLDDGLSTISSKMSRLSLHSVAKKSSRLGVYITSSLGFASVTKDSVFDEHETMFRSLEKTIRFFLKNSEAFVSLSYDDFLNQQFLAETLIHFYYNSSREVEHYKNLHRRIIYTYWNEFKTCINKRVYEPLNNLLDLFEGPSILILKRHDKLLDYEACLSKNEKMNRDSKLVSKLIQDELAISKNTYEALNLQLLEELPPLINTSLDLFNDCLSSFVTARKLLCGKITNQYLNLIENNFPGTNKGELIDSVIIKQTLIYNQLRRFSFANKSLTEHESHKTEITGLPQNINQKIFLKNTYSENFLYNVIHDFHSTEPLELTVTKGDLVAIIKKQDPMGNTDRWFVHNGATKGFLPKEILEPLISNSTSLETSPQSRLSQVIVRNDDSSRSSKSPTPSKHNSSENLPPPYEEVVLFSSNKITQETTKKKEDTRDSHLTNENNFYYAECDFQATGEFMISMKKGQIVLVLCKNDLEGNSEWWLVEDRFGKKGYVPGNHLEKYNI